MGKEWITKKRQKIEIGDISLTLCMELAVGSPVFHLLSSSYLLFILLQSLRPYRAVLKNLGSRSPLTGHSGQNMMSILPILPV